MSSIVGLPPVGVRRRHPQASGGVRIKEPVTVARFLRLTAPA